MFRKLASLFAVTGLLISLSACSTAGVIDASSNRQSDSKTLTTSSKATVHDIKFKDKISVEQGTKLKLLDYCTSDGKKDNSLVIVPASVDTSKVGKQSLDVTITDKNGIIYTQTVEITVTAKSEPEPTTEGKNDDTQQGSTTDNQQNNQSTYVPDTQPSSGGTTYTPPQTVQPAASAPQPETPSYTQPSQDAPDNDVIATKPSTSDGAPAGSTYDNINSCDAAASKTKSHACTWSSSANAWVLTY